MATTPGSKAARSNDEMSAAELFQAVRDGSGEGKFLLIHLWWGGCRGACDPEGNSNLEKALNEFVGGHSDIVTKIDVPWRPAREITVGEESVYLFDYYTLQTPAYQLFREMVLCKRQKYGMFQPVDTYPIPPWERPHFPQVVMIDGSSVCLSALGHLVAANTSGTLVNAGNEPILYIEEKVGEDEYRHDCTNRKNLHSVFPEGSVLIHLVNEHFYPANDDDEHLKKCELFATLECCITGRQDRVCFRYMRGPIVNGCDFIKQKIEACSS